MYGGKVIKRRKSTNNNIDEEYDEYYNYVKGLSIDEFSDLVKIDSLDKSYTRTNIKIRRKFIDMYFYGWVNSTYIKLFHDYIQSNRQLTNKYIDWLNNKVENMITPSKGLYRRIERLVETFSSVTPSKSLSCIVFSLKNKDKPGSMRTNYGYLYMGDKISNPFNKPFNFLYICTGPNIVSSDGEFRNKIVLNGTITYYRFHYSDIWNIVEEYLLNKKNIEYFQDYYLHDSLSENEIGDLKKQINVDRYIIDLHVLAWISQYLLVYLNVQSTNIDKFYNDNMFSCKHDSIIFDKLVKKTSINYIKLFYRDTSSIYVVIKTKEEGTRGAVHTKNLTEQFVYNPEMGQKIIHISKEAFNNIMNIEYSVWLECYILQMVTNLYLNSITPGISMFHDWVILYGVNKFMFNNEEIYNKAEISDNLIDNHQENKMIEYSPDDTSDDSVYSTDKAVLFLIEYVGRPINDLATLLKSEEFQENIESIFSNYDYFKKYIFEITYSLYCINTKVSVIHGDLHLNNTTLNRVSKPYLLSKDGEKNDYRDDMIGLSVYVVDDEVYSFTNNGTYGNIIDFSRSFINKLQPSQIELRGDMKLIHNKQRIRIVGYYKLFFPAFYKKYGASMALLLDKDFDIAFRIFAAIDMYVHTDRLKRYVSLHNDILKVVPKVNKLIDKINTLTSYYLTVTMEEYLNGKITNIDDVVNPNYNIIKRYFAKNIVDVKKNKSNTGSSQLSDIYMYNNEMKYSYYEFDKLPPRLRDRRIQKNKSKSVSILDVAGDVPKKTEKYLNTRRVEIQRLMGF